MSQQEPKLRIKQVWTYPIKSLRGTTSSFATATYTGFAYDRRFMLYRPTDKKNMHVSQYPEMCLFLTEIHDSKILVRYTKDHTFDHPEQKLKDAGSTLEVDLEPTTTDLDEVEINMHSSPATGYDMGTKHNSWFSARFGYPVQLLYIGSNRRKILGNMPPSVAGAQREGRMGSSLESPKPEQKSWLSSITSTLWSTTQPTYPGVDEGIGFADCAPYLIISTKSWENAQSRLDPYGETLEVSKFRPNIIVEGADSAYDEDYWGDIDILPQDGSEPIRIVLTQNCARCNSLNVDYETGKVGTGEAGKILKKLQSDRRVDKGTKWSPIFGRYGFMGRVEGDVKRICVGDEVRIVRRNEERMRFEWPNLST